MHVSYAFYVQRIRISNRPKLNCRRKMKNLWRKRNAHIETMVLLSHTNTHTRTENDLITQNGTDKEWKRTMSSEVLIIITSMVELISKEIAVYGWLRICQCVFYWCERIASIVLDIAKNKHSIGCFAYVSILWCTSSFEIHAKTSWNNMHCPLFAFT